MPPKGGIFWFTASLLQQFEDPHRAPLFEVIDLLGRGQGVFGIAVGRVLREVEASLVNIATLHLDDMDELAARRASRKAV